MPLSPKSITQNLKKYIISNEIVLDCQAQILRKRQMNMKLDRARPKLQLFVFLMVSFDSTEEINCAILREFEKMTIIWKCYLVEMAIFLENAVFPNV